MSPHLGAHADAPLHYAREASAIGDVDLEPFLGPCRVIHAIDRGALITPEHLAHAIDGLPPRVLVRTCVTAPTEWSPAFSAFAPETIAWLSKLGVRLVGIDSQSVDPAESKTLDSHQQLLAHDMRVLENLVLDEIEAGDYELIALPLKLTGADASPVRAVLRSLVKLTRDECVAHDAADPLAPLREQLCARASGRGRRHLSRRQLARRAAQGDRGDEFRKWSRRSGAAD